MITRIYVDNFRSLVNFEWKPGRVALLMGANGSGKTSLIDVLWAVRKLIGKAELKDWFPPKCRTRWETRTELTVEVDVQRPQGLFSYRLLVEHGTSQSKSRVKRETLHLDGRVLLEFVDGDLQLFSDDSIAGPKFKADASRSGLGAVAASSDNLHLTNFKDWVDDKLWFFQLDARRMTGRVEDDEQGLASDASNFATWLRRRMTQDLSATIAATAALSEVIGGFKLLQVSGAGTQLEATFSSEGSPPHIVDFAELSDGQRQLCALYFLQHLVARPGRMLVFDEPDNYVALREIQPWLMEMLDLALAEGGPQVWFISHHPELINQLAPGHGVRFFRNNGGPTRIEPFKGADGLNSAEVVARGWDGE